MIKKIFTVFVCLLSYFFSVGQDYSLSQPFESAVMLNPANAGLTYPLRTQLNYRQQWRSIINKPFTTVIASADAKIFSQGKTGSSLGLGIVIANDQAGTGKLNTLNANLALMGKVMLSEIQTLSAGIIGGVMQRKVNLDALTWGNQFNGLEYDATISSGESFSTERTLSPDIGAGMQWSYGKGASTLSSNDALGAQVGFAAYHINSPKAGFQGDVDGRYIRLLFHGSFSYGLKNTPFQINPNFLLQMQGPSRMYFVGAYWKYRLQESSKYTGYLSSRSLNLATFYRVGDAFITGLQLEWDDFAFGISYDINLSSLTKASKGRGATEISLRYIPVKLQKSHSLI